MYVGMSLKPGKPEREYDSEVGALYIRFARGLVARQVEVTPEVIVDQDVSGAILRVEILAPSLDEQVAREWLRAHGCDV